MRRHHKPGTVQFALKAMAGSTKQLIKRAFKIAAKNLAGIAILMGFNGCTTLWPGNVREYNGPYLSLLNLRKGEPSSPDRGQLDWLMIGPNGGIRF